MSSNDSTDGCCAASSNSADAASDVCSLPSAELAERIDLIRRDLAPRATSTRELADGYEFGFGACNTMATKLEEFVAFERECCGGLEWQLARNADAITLRVTGPGAREAFAELLAGTSEAARE